MEFLDPSCPSRHAKHAEHFLELEVAEFEFRSSELVSLKKVIPTAGKFRQWIVKTNRVPAVFPSHTPPSTPQVLLPLMLQPVSGSDDNNVTILRSLCDAGCVRFTVSSEALGPCTRRRRHSHAQMFSRSKPKQGSVCCRSSNRSEK